MIVSGRETKKRFVVQEHIRSGDTHWDLMLESGERLQTWRLDLAPEQIVERPAGATRIFDHPPRFLTYEGPVQNGTGRVRIVDTGTYHSPNETADRIELTLAGRILNGPFVLERAGKAQWRLTATKNQIER